MNKPELGADSELIDEAGTPTPPPRVSAWKVSLLLIVIAGATTGAFFLGWLPKVQQHMVLAEEAEQRANSTPEVKVMSPYPAETSTDVLLPGEIKAMEETVIFPRTSGYLRKWHVDIGDVVKKGQLLAEIDTPEIDQQLEEAQATVEQLKARRQVAETQLDLAGYTLGRLERLIASNAASQQEYDERKAELAVANHRVQVAEADIAAGMADLQRIKELQSFTNVYAPFDGTISERSIDLGQLVTSGNDQAQSLFRLLRTDRVRVVVHVPQLYASSIKTGDQAQLIVREMPTRKFTGHIARTAKAIDLQTRTMRIEVELENEEGLLLPGAYVQVQLAVHRTDPPLVVPASALIFNADGAQLATVNSQNHIELRAVEVEADQGGTLGIATGITDADRVVINPGERLTNGLSVNVVSDVSEES
ncbi:efflux RND transporter periplasmic adaptor subunit [Bremerella sp. P1]|uniref:efflux RND transporter periplasmic adaptor subunit n=1 Tax=Bremerella sp. P1 TaxID=3026424 RepID=UPI002367F729|nr:efflux RND transporter periplasmic adaptor subunit [Bremerella sp. P1]WDI41738.1 efflux RND transporter periplasmic adaptor subunit [Bremerella sp. P1]